MSRYSRSSDDGTVDQRFQKKRRLLHDLSSADESLLRFKKANDNWNEVLDSSYRRDFNVDMRKHTAENSEISRQNTYYEKNPITPGSSFYCNTDGDSEYFANSFRKRVRGHKRGTVLKDDFERALSDTTEVTQDPSFVVDLESNKSCFVANNSINCASDNSFDKCLNKRMKVKSRRHNFREHSAKEKGDFENVLNDVTSCEYQNRTVPFSVENNENEVTNVDVNEVSHFKSDVTGYGAPSAITYSRQIITQMGQVGGMSYVTISEVKDRVIIPGRSCPRPKKKGRREDTDTEWINEVNYNNPGSSCMNTANAERGIYEEDILENPSDVVSDFEVDSEYLNRSGPIVQHNSPLMRSREVKRKKNRKLISQNDYEEVNEDDSITLSPIKAIEYHNDESHISNLSESYGSPFNNVSGRPSSRRSILREISQNEFEIRSLKDNTLNSDDEDSNDLHISGNSELSFLSKMDAVKKVHDHITKEKIMKDMSGEMTKRLKGSFSESNPDCDENFLSEPVSDCMIIERRKKRRNKSKLRIEKLDNAIKSISDSFNIDSCEAEENSSTKREVVPVEIRELETSPKFRERNLSEEEDQISRKYSLNSSGSTRMEACEINDELIREDNPLLYSRKVKRSSKRECKGSREFNLTVQNASLSSIADLSTSLQNSTSLICKENMVIANAIDDDDEDAFFPPDLILKEKSCSIKMKGNYSKSMLIIDPDIEKEDNSLSMHEKLQRRRRAQAKPLNADEFNVYLEDVSSNIEDSIPSVATHQASKLSDLADQIPCIAEDPKEVLEQDGINNYNNNTSHESSASDCPDIHVEKECASGKQNDEATINQILNDEERENKSKSRFSLNELTMDATSTAMKFRKRKKRRLQVQTVKVDEFNLLMADISSNSANSIASLAESSYSSNLSQNPNVPLEEVPEVNVQSKDYLRQQAEDDNTGLNQQKQQNNEVKGEIIQTKLELKEVEKKETKSPKTTAVVINGKNSPVKALASVQIDVLQNDIFLDNKESNFEESNPTHKSKLKKCSVMEADIVLEHNISSKNLIGKNKEHAASGTTDEIPKFLVSLSNDTNTNSLNTKTSNNDESDENRIPNVSPQSYVNSMKSSEDVVPAIDHGVSEGTKINISDYKSSLNEELSMDSIVMAAGTSNVGQVVQNKEVNIPIKSVLFRESDSKSIISDNVNHPSLQNADSTNEKMQEMTVKTGVSYSQKEYVTTNIDQLVNEEANNSKSGLNSNELMMDANSAVSDLRREEEKKINQVTETSHGSNSAQSTNVPVEDIVEVNVEPRQQTDDGLTTLNPKMNDQVCKDTSQTRFELNAVMHKDAMSPEINIPVINSSSSPMNASHCDQSDALLNYIVVEENGKSNSEIGSRPESVKTNYSLNSANNAKESVLGSHNFPIKNNQEVISISAEQSLSTNVELMINLEQENADNVPTLKGNVNRNVEKDTNQSGLTSDVDVRKGRKYFEESISIHGKKCKETDALENDVLSKKRMSSSTEVIPSSELKMKQLTSVAAGTAPELTIASTNLVRKNEVDPASVTTDVIPSVAIESHVTSEQGNAARIASVNQQMIDDAKVSKSGVDFVEDLSQDAYSSPSTIKRKKRKNKRKSVKVDEFDLVIEDFSISNASDPNFPIAETSSNEKSAKDKILQETVQSDVDNVEKVEDVASAIDQCMNDKAKRNLSKSEFICDEELNIYADSTVLKVKRCKRKRNAGKPVKVDEFKLAMENISLSNATDSMSSITEDNNCDNSAKTEISECRVNPKNTSREMDKDVVHATAMKLNDKNKEDINESSLAFDEELSLDLKPSAMNVRRQKRKRNQKKPVVSDVFKSAVKDASSSDTADSIFLAATTSCEGKILLKPTENGISQVVGDSCDLAITNIREKKSVNDGKPSDKKSFQSAMENENMIDPPEIECSLDESLSVSKISNAFVNDLAESTRGLINNKGMISEYFENVSGITCDALIGNESEKKVKSHHSYSNKSSDSISKKVETCELPQELCKSAGDNSTLEGFRNYSLEKHSSRRLKNKDQMNVSELSCDVDLAIQPCLPIESNIGSAYLLDKNELEIIGPPSELPSKHELSISLKSNINSECEELELSCNSVPNKKNKDISSREILVDNFGRENPNESFNSNRIASLASFSESISTNFKTDDIVKPKGIMEKVIESNCEVASDQTVEVKGVFPSLKSKTLAICDTVSKHTSDSPPGNLADIISDTSVLLESEMILTDQPSNKEPISCTSSAVDVVDKTHQPMYNFSSHSTNLLSDAGDLRISSNQNVEIMSSVEQKRNTGTLASNIGLSKEEIKSSQANCTSLSKVVSKLPVPIRGTKVTNTSKSTYLLKTPSTLSIKSTLHTLPEFTEVQSSKLDNCRQMNNETFTILPSKILEETENLVQEITKEPCNVTKSVVSEVNDNVLSVAKESNMENLNTSETKAPGITNSASEKCNVSSSIPCLVSQVKTSTTINELTFIKTSAPAMTSTPRPSILTAPNIKYAEDVSMLSGISELAIDQESDQELLNSVEHRLDAASKGNNSFIESSPAVNELTYIKPSCQSPPIREETSKLASDRKQDKVMLNNKNSISVMKEAIESGDGKVRGMVYHSPDIEDVQLSPQKSAPCPMESSLQREKGKINHSAKELTFIISAAPIISSPSKVPVLDKVNEKSQFSCAPEPVDEFVQSSNTVSSVIKVGISEKMDSAVPFEGVGENSVGNEISTIFQKDILNVVEGNCERNSRGPNSSISSVDKMLQDSTNMSYHPKSDDIKNDTQRTIPHSIECAIPLVPNETQSKSTSPKPKEMHNELPEKSEILNELLLLSPFSRSRWNDICNVSNCHTSVVSSEPVDPKRNSLENVSENSYNSRSSKHSLKSAIALEQAADSSEFCITGEVEVSHLRVLQAKSFELKNLKKSYQCDSEKDIRNAVVGGQEVNVSGPFCAKKVDGSHFMHSSEVKAEFIQHKPSSSLLSERSSLRPSISNHDGWNSMASSSAKESDADSTRPGPPSHTSVESSESELIETLSTPRRTRYQYFSTPTTAERKAVQKVLDRIDASVVRRKKQQDLILDTIFPKVLPSSSEFKKPRVPPKPKRAQVEDLDEDEEIKPLVKKKRLPVWARKELKNVVTEAIDEYKDCFIDAEEFLFDLVETIKLVMKSKRVKEVRQGVQKIKQNLFDLKLITTLRDFYQFVRDYLPYEFRIRSIPSSGCYKFNPVWEMEADLDCPLF